MLHFAWYLIRHFKARQMASACALVLAGNLAPLTPAMGMDARYRLSADGQEVTDTVTRLIWRRCPEGMTFVGEVCSDTAAIFNHEAALQRAQAEAIRLRLPWRLPNVKELSSIVSRASSSPAIDVEAFPNTPSLYFWSATPYVGGGNLAWSVHFRDGKLFVRGANGDRSASFFVRLVRTSSTAAVPSAPAVSTGDTMIASWHDTTAAPIYGAETYLYTCGAGWGGTGQALLRFDHGQVPTTAGTVYLNLYAISGDDINGIGTTMEVVRVNGNWSEATTQWISRPALAEIHGTFATPNGQYGRWVRVPITSLVKAWQNGTYANQGLAVLGVTNPFTPCRMYASREAPGNEPYLSWE